MSKMTINEINKTYKKLFDNVYYTLIDLVLESKVKSGYIDECKALRLPDNGKYDDFVELVFINGDLTFIDEDGSYTRVERSSTIEQLIDIINQFKK